MHWFPANEMRYATYDHISKIVSCMKQSGEAPVFPFYSALLQEMQDLESKMREGTELIDSAVSIQ